MTQPADILYTSPIPTDVKAHIISNTRSDMQKQRLWILCEATFDMQLYRRFFRGKVTVYPANITDINGKTKTSCHTVMRLVSEIKNGGYTQRIIGIRDRDYTDFASYKHREQLPDNVFMTDTRDLEMMLYSSHAVKEAVVALHPCMQQKITECEPLLRYSAYLRIWHNRNKHEVSLNDLTAKCMCTDNSPKSIKINWKQELVDRYNQAVGVPGLMTVTDLERFGRCRILASSPFTSICRGHDFLELLGKYIDDGHIQKGTIQATLATAYTIADFQLTKLAQDINSLIRPWGIIIDQSDIFRT